MELMNHSDVADKDLVNAFGGVAYDHESMPRVVAVHSWTAECLPSGSNLCSSMNIGIRLGTPQNAEGVGSLRRCTGSKENWGVRNTKFENKFTHSSFGLEKLNQTEALQTNTVTTSTGANGILRTLSQDHSRNAFEECYPSHNKTFWRTELKSLSQMCNVLLTEHTNNKVGFEKSSEAITEVLPLKLPSYNFSEAILSGNRNLENLEWSRVGVLADTRSEQLNHSHQHMQLNTNNSSQLYLGNNYKAAAAGNDCLQGRTSDSSFSHKAPNPNSRLSISPKQIQIAQTPLLSSRKRPRKSIPRKIDIEWQNSCSGSHSSDSEETLSADEITSDSLNQCVPVSSSHNRCSPRSDEESSSNGTKVLFKRTAAGVWSVSPLNLDMEVNKELEGSLKSNNETTQIQASSDAQHPLHGSTCVKPGNNVCLFTDRPIASLVPYDPLDPHCVEPLYSSALDREARIKDLLSKQGKLLAEMRQKNSSE